MAVVETAAFGAVLAIGAGSPVVYTEIKGVHNGPGLTRGNEIITARHHGRTGTVKRSSFRDEGQCNFDLYYDSNDTQHQALMTAFENKAVTKFRLTLTDTGAEVYTFDAIVAQMSGSFQVEGFNMYSVSLDITGEITRT